MWPDVPSSFHILAACASASEVASRKTDTRILQGGEKKDRKKVNKKDVIPYVDVRVTVREPENSNMDVREKERVGGQTEEIGGVTSTRVA